MATLTDTASPQDVSDFSRFVHKESGHSTFEIAVSGARCANCIAKIESGVRAMPGVETARLNLSTGKLLVSWGEKPVPPQSVLRRVRDLGYEAQPFEAAAVLNAEEKEGRFLLHCLAVAGFGTVFVMGLMDAVWYGGSDMSLATRQIFFWLAAAVSVPSTLYSAQPFLRSAWRSLAKHQTNMDVPISAALILSLTLSVYQTLAHGMNTYFDAAVMLTFLLLIGRYLDFRLRDRARGAAQHLLTLQSQLARRLKADGSVETIAAKQIAPGDRILLASGERAPVDGTIEDVDTEADVSLVTGESAPVAVPQGGFLHAGSVIVGRPVQLRASALVQNSLVADLARLLEAGQQTRSLYVRLADRAARTYVPFVSAMAVLVFAGWMIAGGSVATAATNAITILVITCPCALGLAVPAVQVVATGRLFGEGLFVKSGDALERLAEIDTAVFDKTGTLTLGVPVLANASEIPLNVLLRTAEIARTSRHPLARSLAAASKSGRAAAGVCEVPGSGLETDAGERLGNATWCGGTSDSSSSELWFRMPGAAPVRFAFHDAIRDDTTAMISSLRARGIAIEMLTGDHAGPAAALARQAGIQTWHADVNPGAKAARIETLRAQGRHVLMVGDGINDAGAMALAHVSIAPGTAADVSQLAADIVLRGDSLTPIVEAIDVARKARRLVLENFTLAAIYNLTAIPLAALGLVTPLIAAATMAGSSLIVTLNALRLGLRK